MVQRPKGKRGRLWVRLPLKEMKYLIVSRSGNEVKRDFRYSTRNALRIGQKVGNGIVLTLGSLGRSVLLAM